MGKAAEAPDDFLMAQDIGEVVLGLFALFCWAIVDPFTEQRDRARLVDRVFAVFEGQIEKESPVARQHPVKSAIDGAACDSAGERVGGIGQRGATINVAGKLIEQDDQSESVRRGFFPGGKRAGCGAFDQGQEAIANIAIEGLVFFEP